MLSAEMISPTGVIDVNEVKRRVVAAASAQEALDILMTVFVAVDKKDWSGMATILINAPINAETVIAAMALLEGKTQIEKAESRARGWKYATAGITALSVAGFIFMAMRKRR